MNQSEKRRKQLLNQTRSLYTDKYDCPAVHPRYQNVYRNMYENEQTKKGTFGVRMFLCLLLFVGYLYLDYQKTELFEITSSDIEQYISEDLALDIIRENML